MNTQSASRHRRLAWAAVILFALAGCTVGQSAGSATPTSLPSTPMPPAASAAASPASAPPSAPAPTSAPSSMAPSASTAAVACPPSGSVVTVDQLLKLDRSCAWTNYRVRGWWDGPRSEDGLPDGTFATVLRGSLPAYVRPEGILRYGKGLPVDAANVPAPFAGFAGQWVEVKVQAVPNGGEPHCAWVFGQGGASNPAQPVWTCPAYGQVQSAKTVTPPASALRNCPSAGRVMPVEVFVRYPRACFGSRSVQVSGWLSTWYLIGGWESSWTIQPGWLWSMQIGRLPMLSPSGLPGYTDTLDLHIRPGSPMAAAQQQRWVVLTGRYANKAEVASCRVVNGPGPVTGDRPTLAEARQDCANAFVATGVRTGAPG